MAKTFAFNVRVDGTDKIAANFADVDRNTKRVTKELNSLRKTLDKLEQGGKESEKLRQSLAKQGKTVKELRGEYAALTKEQFELREKRKKLGRELRNHTKDLDVAADSVFGLRKRLIALRNEYDRLSKAQREGAVGKRLQGEIKDVHNQVSEAEQATGRFQRNVGNYRSALTGLGDNLLDVVGVPPALSSGLSAVGGAAALTAGGVAAAGFAAVKAAKQFGDLEDQLAQVRKTTGFTREEAFELHDQIQAIDTRTSVKELLEIAKAAGRLGVEGVDNVADFTQTIDKLQVALGDDLGGTAEEIATTVGKIASSFGLEEEFGLAEGLERAGDIINELANTTKGQAQFIVDFTARLQGMGAQIGMSLPDVAALGATMDSLGLRAESSSTAVQTFIQRIAQSPEKFEKLVEKIGLTTEEFREMTRNAPTEAIIAVLEAGRSTETGMKALEETIANLGITGKRESSTILALSKNLDQFRRNINTGDRALKENISTQEEFEVQNTTFNASLEKMSKEFGNLGVAIGEVFADDIKSAAEELGSFVKWVRESKDAITSFVSVFSGLSGGYLGDLIKSGFGKGVKGASTIIEWATGVKFDPEKAKAKAKAEAKAASEAYRKEVDRIMKNWQPFNLARLMGEGSEGTEDLPIGIRAPEQEGDGGAFDTYEKLKQRASELQKQIKNLAFQQMDYNDQMQEYRDIQAKLRSIDEIFATDDTGRKLAIMEGSISGLNKQLQQAQEELNAIDPESAPSKWEEQAEQVLLLQRRVEMLNDKVKQYRETWDSPAEMLPPLEEDTQLELPSIYTVDEKALDEKLDMEERIESINRERFNLLEKLARDFRSGQIESEEEYNQLRERVAHEYDLRIQRNKINSLKEGSAERAEAEAKYQEMRLAYEQETNEKIKKQRKDIEKQIQDELLNVAQAAANTYFAIQRQKNEKALESALSTLETEYERRIEAAEGNDELQERLREEQAEKEEQLRKEAFKKEQDAAVAQALINGALAITKALATLGPIAGAIAATGVAITTALQVAEIKSASYRYGGMTEDKPMGFGDEHGEFVGYVHKKEYVAPTEQLADYPELFSFLENDRKRRFSSFRYGGFTTPPPPILTNPQTLLERQDRAFSPEQMQQLGEILGTEVYKASEAGTRRGSREGVSERRKRDALLIRLEQNRVV